MEVARVTEQHDPREYAAAVDEAEIPRASRGPQDPPGWPEPKALPPITDPVSTMPVTIVPAPFTGWVADVAERLCVPVEYVALPAISAVGSVVGRAASIRPKRRDDWTVV